MAPQRLVVKSKYANIHGGYFLVDSNDGLPAYRRDKDNSVDGNQAWIFNTNKRWYVSGSRPEASEAAFSYLAQSLNDATSPNLVDWPTDKIDSVKEPRPTMDLIKREALHLYVDSTFPHSPKSIGRNDLQAEWVPARCLWQGQGSLFDGVEPRDLLQGGLGDCWFVAALACLAEFPDRVRELFLHPANDKLDPIGKYTVRLFDNTPARQVIEIDEFIPCRPLRWWDDEADPLFSKPHGNEAWVLLLEKAMAKMMGSYEALNGGSPGVAFRAFTGQSNTFKWQREGGNWEKWILEKDSVHFISEGSPAQQSSEDVFLSLAEYDRSSYLMSASISSSANNESGKEVKRRDGLVEGHAYSVLQVVEVEGHRLLCLRNPWGNDQEWQLGWSDRDKNWIEFPRVKQKLQPRFGADGLFWMSWDDFQTRFNNIHVCACAMRTQDAIDAHSKASQEGHRSPEIPSAPPRVVRKPPTSIPTLHAAHQDSLAPSPPHLPNGYPQSGFSHMTPGHYDSHAPPPPNPGHLPNGHPHANKGVLAPGHYDGHAPPPPGHIPNSHPHMSTGHYDSHAPPPPIPGHFPGGKVHSITPPITSGRHDHHSPPGHLPSVLPSPSGRQGSQDPSHASRPSYRPWKYGDVVDPNEPPPPEPPKPKPPNPPPPSHHVVSQPPPHYVVSQPHVVLGHSSRHFRPSTMHQPTYEHRHRSPRRKRGGDTPPTPPPPDMPFATSFSPQASPWSTNQWSGGPISWNPLSSPYPSQPILQHLMPSDASSDYHSRSLLATPLLAKSPANAERTQIRAEIASLSHRVRSLMQANGGSTSQRARLLVQELGNIESFCSDLGDEWSAVQNMLESLRSELVGHEVRPLAHKSLAQQHPLNSSRRSSGTAPPSEVRRSLIAAPTQKRADDPRSQAREAFRERMTKLMRLYGDGDNAYDVDSIFREMDSEYPHGAPLPQDRFVSHRTHLRS